MLQRGLALAVKRAIDVSVASVALVAAAPVLAAAAAAIVVSDGMPVLFRQERPGRGGEPFRLFKFRTMRVDREREGLPQHDAERLTRVGRWLRATSVDELPQLINVLRGDMSLVGPRPLLMRYLPRYSPRQARRHEVLPGITGWAQVNGRNALSWTEKFELDVWYVEHWSPWLDVRVLGKTALRVLARDGVSSEGHVTMPEFMGDISSSAGRFQGAPS
jgi:lipopolysaccharide/colanic/teichoic acid biosynthesis glycosyltransferase